MTGLPPKTVILGCLRRQTNPWLFAGGFLMDAQANQLTYLIHIVGELCLSPIGLAMVTKLALPKETGLAMGGWFLSIAMANYVAGLLAAEAAGGGEAAGTLTQYASVFDSMFVIGIITAVAYFLLAPLINKLMHGVK